MRLAGVAVMNQGANQEIPLQWDLFVVKRHGLTRERLAATKSFVSYVCSL